MSQDSSVFKPHARRVLSAAARAETAARKIASRPVALDELTRVLRWRAGRSVPTPRQLGILGDLCSWCLPLEYLRRGLAQLLADCRVPDEAAGAYFDGPAWAVTLDRAERAARGERRGLPPEGEPDGPRCSVDPRRDWSAARLVTEFGITDEEAQDLGLRLLVSERRRSELRRRAEGVRPAAEAKAARPPSAAEQAAAQGVSRRTLFRRAEQARIAAVKLAAAGPAAAPVDPEPWVAAGVSRATWYRRQALARETENGTPRDHNRETSPEAGSEEVEYESYTDTVARSATRSLTPAVNDFATSESRRLAVLAGRLGLTWTGSGGSLPYYWWTVPPGRTLTAEEATELDAAVTAATAAEDRRERIERAREQREAAADTRTPAERWAAWQAEIAERDARLADYDTCPAGVTPAAWAAVPRAMRERVLTIAAQAWFSGWLDPDPAVAHAVEVCRRQDAIVARVLREQPDADLAAVVRLAADHWRQSTADGAAGVLADLAEERARQAAEHEAEQAERARERERRVWLYVLDHRDLADQRAELAAEALRLLAEGDADDPARAVGVASYNLRRRLAAA